MERINITKKQTAILFTNWKYNAVPTPRSGAVQTLVPQVEAEPPRKTSLDRYSTAFSMLGANQGVSSKSSPSHIITRNLSVQIAYARLHT